MVVVISKDARPMDGGYSLYLCVIVGYTRNTLEQVHLVAKQNADGRKEPKNRHFLHSKMKIQKKLP